MYLDHTLDDEDKLNNFEFIRMYYSENNGKVDINAAMKNHSGEWVNKRFSKNWNFRVKIKENELVGDLKYLTKEYLDKEEPLAKIVTASKTIKEVETLTKSSSEKLNILSKKLLEDKTTPAQVKKLLNESFLIPEGVRSNYKNVWELIGFNPEQTNLLLKNIDVIKDFVKVRLTRYDMYKVSEIALEKLLADVLTLLNYIYVSDQYIIDNDFEKRDFRDMDIESFKIVVDTYIEILRNINEFSKEYLQFGSILPHITFDYYIHGISSVKDLEYFRDNTESILRKMRENYRIEEDFDYYGNFINRKIHFNQSFREYCEVRRDIAGIKGRAFLPEIRLLNKPSRIEEEERVAIRLFRELQLNSGDGIYSQILKKSKNIDFNDDDFIIFQAPSLLSIFDEGEALRHCVAEYINPVISRKTSIYFLRSAAHPDKPLYTIELKKNRVVQARGFANKGLNKKAAKFVAKWAKTYNLKNRTS